MADDELRWRLHNRDMARTLMDRTGDGSRVTIRDLAAAIGCHPSHVGEVLTGVQQTVSTGVATAWAARIGVDVLILWEPDERAATAQRPEPEAVSA